MQKLAKLRKGVDLKRKKESEPTVSVRVPVSVFREISHAAIEADVNLGEMVSLAWAHYVNAVNPDLSEATKNYRKFGSAGISGGNVVPSSTKGVKNGPSRLPKKSAKLEKEIDKSERGVNESLPDEKEADPLIRASGGKNPGGAK